MKYLLLLCSCIAVVLVNAQKIQPTTVRSAALYNKAMAQIKPVYKDYVTQTAKAFSNRRPNADSLRSSMRSPGNSLFGNLTNADVETLMLLVMQASANDAEADIREQMSAMEKNRQRKEALRKEEESLKASQQRMADSNKIKMSVYNTATAKRLAAIKKEKDTIDEMTQQDQLQLQQLMDKKSQLESMISNIMKAQSDTQGNLSNALKAS